MRPSDETIRAALLDLAKQRAPKTFCPSEVARVLAGEWRPLMPDVRRVAAEMDMLGATQKGEPANPVDARGPIRLGWKSE